MQKHKMMEQLKASYDRLATRSEELKNEIAERKRAEEKLLKLNEELEQRIRDRTDELKSKNEEFENEINERKRMEESLRLVQFAVDHASDCIFWIRPDARFANVNDSTCRRLGYDRDELLNLTVFDIDPAFPREAWDAHWREIRARRSFTIETRHRAKTGEVFPVEVSVNYVEYGGAEYNFAFARDISKRKRDEEALTREREFSRALLDSMADGVVACDDEGTLALFNRTAREWHGLDPMKLPPEEWAEHYDLFCPDGITPLPTEEIPLSRAFRGEIVADAGMAIVARGQAVRFILASGGVIRDAEGNKLGAVVVMRDVTELRRVEEELRKANEELEDIVADRTSELKLTLERLKAELAERKRVEAELLVTQFSVDNTADAVFWVRPDGSFAYSNKAACSMFGHSSKEFLRLKTFDLNPEHKGAAWQEHWEELRRHGFLRFETSLVRKNGSRIPVEITANHVEFEGQEYNCAIIRDITERNRAEEELKKYRDHLEELVKERTEELEKKNAELEKMNKLFVGRELRMIELKERIAELEKKQ